MPNRGKFIGNDNLYVPDAPTIGDATAGNTQVSVAFTAPSDVGNDDITAYGVSATDGTNVIGATGSSSPVTVTGLTNGTSYTAQAWAINDYGNGPLSAATASFTPVLSKCLHLGGFTSVGGQQSTNIVETFNLDSQGNATDFGDLSANRNMLSSASSSTRAVVFGGKTDATQSNVVDIIEYFTFASAGNATDFGNLTAAKDKAAGFGNDTKGLYAGGKNSGNSRVQNIDAITIASTGNATDFGDISGWSSNKTDYISGLASPTRGIMAGQPNTIHYVTFASAGNSTDFGDMTVDRYIMSEACSSNTRGMFAGGILSDFSGRSNVIDFITIASTGNATDFGDLSAGKREGASTSSRTKGSYMGGETSSTQGDGLNEIEFWTIATTGNATDFGDLTKASEEGTACSTTHGGLA